MRRPFLVLLALIAAALAGGCGKKKPLPSLTQPTTTQAPAYQPKKAAPPPPLSADQKVRIEFDFEAARKVILEARDLRLKGEAIEAKDGREAANDTLVQARKKYQQAFQMTERWVEPEVHEITQAQLETDGILKSHFEERGRWIQENISMGQKLNAR